MTKLIRSAFCTLIIQSFLKFPPIGRNFLGFEIFHEILKILLENVKHGILNVWLWSAMQEDTAKLYQFLYHVTPVVTFSFN